MPMDPWDIPWLFYVRVVNTVFKKLLTLRSQKDQERSEQQGKERLWTTPFSPSKLAWSSEALPLVVVDSQ